MSKCKARLRFSEGFPQSRQQQPPRRRLGHTIESCPVVLALQRLPARPSVVVRLRQQPAAKPKDAAHARACIAFGFFLCCWETTDDDDGARHEKEKETRARAGLPSNLMRMQPFLLSTALPRIDPKH